MGHRTIAWVLGSSGAIVLSLVAVLVVLFFDHIKNVNFSKNNAINYYICSVNEKTLINFIKYSEEFSSKNDLKSVNLEGGNLSNRHAIFHAHSNRFEYLSSYDPDVRMIDLTLFPLHRRKSDGAVASELSSELQSRFNARLRVDGVNPTEYCSNLIEQS